MTRGLVVVLTVGLLALAGGAPAGVSMPQQSNVRTAPSDLPLTTTPAETPNGTTVLPPGTSESGIDNATRLLETHQNRLANETYSVRLNVDDVSEVTDENESFLRFDVDRISETAEKGSNETLVTFVYENATAEGSNSSQTYWMTDEALAFKDVDDETTMYSYEPSTGRFARLIDNAIAKGWAEPSFAVRPYLLGIDYEHAGTVTRDGRTLHRFTSAELNASAVEEHDLSEFPSSVESVDSTVLVDEQGIIRSFNASVIRTRGNESVTSEVTYAVPELGNVTPATPTWVTTELPHLDASMSEDGTVIAVNHTGGMTVSTATLLVYSPSIHASGDFAGTFAPGDTLYFYITQDDPERVLVSQNEPPEVNESFVRLGEDNVSVTPWRIVAEDEDRNRTTIEVEIHENASNHTRSTTTEESSNSSRPFWWQWSSLSSENEYSHDVVGLRIHTTETRIMHDSFREP